MDERIMDEIMEKFDTLPYLLRKEKIKFNENKIIKLHDERSWIEFVIHGKDDETIEWEEQVPSGTKFSMKIFTEYNKNPFRIESHNNELHRNVVINGNNIHIPQKQYDYPPYYSTLASFAAGFPEEREQIREELKQHFLSN